MTPTIHYEGETAEPEHGDCIHVPKDAPLHPCPYNDEINHDSSDVCNCCEVCTEQCARDI